MKVLSFGITYNGIRYGWYDKKLCRLPINIGSRYYPFKELKLVQIGNNFGYRLSQKPFTLQQLKEITIAIEPYILQEINSKDCPF